MRIKLPTNKTRTGKNAIIKINGQEIGPLDSAVVHNDQSNRIAEDPATYKREYLGHFVTDDEFELFVRAWMAYHEAANRIDGHLKPGDPDQGKLGHLAVSAGHEAMAKHIDPRVIRHAIQVNDYVTYHKWQSAKLEALRRLGF